MRLSRPTNPSRHENRKSFSGLPNSGSPLNSPHRECEKKGGQDSSAGESISPASAAANSLETFSQRLRDLCENHRECYGAERAETIRAQTEQVLSLAAELGCLKEPGISWTEFLSLCPGAKIGTEHIVELDEKRGVVGKTTLPPAFGLIPEVVEQPTAVLRPESDQPRSREAIEFVNATPLEYLARWQASNEIFGDDVRLVSVIRWSDGPVSFGITQPQYHGIPAEPREIGEHFQRAGWTRLNDPSGHAVFFNYAFGMIAIDAERRNCFLNEGGLQPFDVILRKPDERLEKFLRIY